MPALAHGRGRQRRLGRRLQVADERLHRAAQLEPVGNAGVARAGGAVDDAGDERLELEPLLVTRPAVGVVEALVEAQPAQRERERAVGVGGEGGGRALERDERQHQAGELAAAEQRRAVELRAVRVQERREGRAHAGRGVDRERALEAREHARAVRAGVVLPPVDGAVDAHVAAGEHGLHRPPTGVGPEAVPGHLPAFLGDGAAQRGRIGVLGVALDLFHVGEVPGELRGAAVEEHVDDLRQHARRAEVGRVDERRCRRPTDEGGNAEQGRCRRTGAEQSAPAQEVSSVHGASPSMRGR